VISQDPEDRLRDLHEIPPKSNEVTRAALDRFGEVVGAVSSSRQQWGRAQDLLEGLQRDVLSNRHSTKYCFFLASALEFIETRLDKMSEVQLCSLHASKPMTHT
jgi:hypothetical protein